MVRQRSDQLFDHVIKPAVHEFGYKALRSDKIPVPGIITSQIIEQLIKSDLVIADLTFRNPNVYYELGIRHMARKHYIQITDPAEKIPFDIRDMRTITVDFRFIDSMEKCKGEIIKQIKSIEKGNVLVVSPVTFIEKLKNVENVPEDQEKINIQFASELQSLRSGVDTLQRKQMDVPKEWSYFEPFQVPTPSVIDDNTLKFSKCIDVFDELSNHGKKEVSEKSLVTELLKTGLFSEKEAKETILSALRAAIIYEPRAGYYKKT